jgi:hypothetical protein
VHGLPFLQIGLPQPSPNYSFRPLFWLVTQARFVVRINGKNNAINIDTRVSELESELAILATSLFNSNAAD